MINENKYEEYKGWCNNCINWKKDKPSPCDSCDQEIPTNFTEEE